MQKPAASDTTDAVLGRRTNWEAIGAVIAVASLIGALIFNSLQMQQSSEGIQLSVYTALHEMVSSSDAQLAIHEKELATLIANRKNKSGDQVPHPKTRRDIEVAFSNFEYLAYLFRHRYLELSGALDSWRPLMACRYYELIVPYWSATAAEDFPNLASLAKTEKCHQ